MTALLLAVFGVAALLAIGSLAFTIRNYAGAAFAIGRQLEACSNPKAAGHSKGLIQRRGKARLASRAAVRRGATARGLRRDRSVSAPLGVCANKIGRRRQFGQGFVSPGTLVFE